MYSVNIYITKGHYEGRLYVIEDGANVTYLTYLTETVDQEELRKKIEALVGCLDKGKQNAT